MFYMSYLVVTMLRDACTVMKYHWLYKQIKGGICGYDDSVERHLTLPSQVGLVVARNL